MVFNRKSVLITGAATGLGLAIATAFGQRGANVVLSDISAERLEQARQSMRDRGHDCLAVEADVRDSNAVNQLTKSVVERSGRIDIIVANAGVYPVMPFLEMEETEWDQVLNTNLKGTFLTCQAGARQMVLQGNGGSIITISSGAANSAIYGWSHYCTSKAGVVMLTRAMAVELARHRVRVNSVLPGYIDVEVGGQHLSERYKSEAREAVPFGRPGTPDDVATAVLMLCAPEAEYITGAAIPVDGGSSAGRGYRLPSE